MKWDSSTLEEVAEINPRLTATPKPDDLVTFVPMSAVSEQTLAIVDGEARPFHEVAKGYTQFQRDDIIIAKITPCFQNGKMARATNLEHSVGVGSTEFHVFRPRKSLDGAYLFQLLRAPVVRTKGVGRMKGAAGQRRVPEDYFAALKIPLPPLAEQKRIAGILDAADALRAKRREALAQLDALLQATFLDLFGDPVSNPMGWDVLTGEQAFNDLTYGTSAKCSDSQTGDMVPVLRIPNVIGGQINREDLKFVELPAKEVENLRLKRDDLLFVRTNGNPDYIGRCARFDGRLESIFASYLIRARLNEKCGLNAEFLKHQIESPAYRREVRKEARTTAGNYNLSTVGIKKFRFVVPPLKLQAQYAAIVEAAEDQKKQFSAHLAELDTLFASLQFRAFRGEL